MKKTVFLLFFAVCAAVRAEVPAQLLLVGEDRPIRGMLRWQPADKQYVIAIRKPQGAIEERTVQADQILQMQVQKPQNWDALQAAVAKSPESALPQLQLVMQNYKMLQWDAEAAALIGKGFLRKNQAAAAVKACKDLLVSNPSAAWDSAMAPVLWKAMLETKQTTGLASMLDKGATSRNRSVAAAAVVRRGDLLFQQGDFKGALKDGFLRAVYLFGDQPEAQAEGLYKAAEAFEKVGHMAYAEKMRQRLMSDFRDSPWGKKLSSAE